MKYKNSVDISVWTAFFYFSNLYYTGHTETYYIFIVSFILLLLLISLRTRNIKFSNISKSKSLIALWGIFTATVVITDLINKGSIINLFLLTTIIPYYFIYKTQYYKDLMEIILKAILFSSILVLLNVFGINILFSDQLLLKSNSVGLFMIFFSVYTLYKFYFSDMYIVLVIFNFLFIILSSSRTALISFSLILIIIMIIKSIRNNITKVVTRVFFTLSIILLVGLVSILKKDMILEIDVVKKITYYSSTGDNFNSRDTIWSYILDNINLTGHSISDIYLLFNLSPHSNFLGILYSNGLIAFLAFCIINILVLVKILRNIKKDQEAIFYLIIILAFILTSFTEFYYSVLGISITYLWYICLGKIIFNLNSKSIKVKSN